MRTRYFVLIGLLALTIWLIAIRAKRAMSQNEAKQAAVIKSQDETTSAIAPQISAQTSDSQPTLQGQTIFSETEFAAKYPGDWKFRKDSKQRIFSVTGGLIVVGQNDEQIRQGIFKLANEVKNWFAKGDFTIDPNVVNGSETDLLRSFDVKQKVGLYSVYQGDATFLTRKADGAIYLVTNRMKDIAEFQDQIQIPLEDAEKIMASNFPEMKIIRPMNPVVFSNNTLTELAWIFTVRTEKHPPSVKTIALSAVSGQILNTEERVIKD